ncbi:methyltransferase domain-containing protein [Chondrinema litorale]|uniref:methyltransferase domain-containing protein n=1 Tax=Chondrinema litorale TaxID=2994555 RepID=UPI0025438A04|nr:methyltransferase domain-containing protein [Chondrinema litorale]UZR92448.1 SAM-dependent methyltransferase [Chondrinema litorale]
MNQNLKDFWNDKYSENKTGWDIGYVSLPLKKYFDQLTDKKIKILIPGAGNSHEAEYLHRSGFVNIYVVDIAPAPIANLRKRVPDFPEDHLIEKNFFDLDYESFFDLIIEQTFFCAITPTFRKNYAEKMHQLLNDTGKLCGLLFNDPLNTDHPPFGGNKQEYISYFKDLYKFLKFETCYNSIAPRKDRELFILLQKS